MGIRNKLLEVVVEEGAIATIKRHLDMYVDFSLEGYSSNTGRWDVRTYFCAV